MSCEIIFFSHFFCFEIHAQVMTVKLIPLTSEQFVFDAKRSLKVSEILNYLHISIKRTALHMAECMPPF